MISSLLGEGAPAIAAIPHGPVASPRQLDAAYDAELVRQFTSGDEAAFVEIVTRFRERIFTTAFMLVHNHADADDITQDTFIRAHRGLAKFRGDSSLATWLYRVATNLSRNSYWYFVRRRRDVTQSLDCPMGDEGTATISDLVATEDPGPSHLAASREFAGLVTLCMDQLPASHREILTLRNELEHSYDEIAAALGIKVGTVKSRIGRARSSLRRLMADHCPEFSPDASLSDWFEPNRPGGRFTITRH